MARVFWCFRPKGLQGNSKSMHRLLCPPDFIIALGTEQTFSGLHLDFFVAQVIEESPFFFETGIWDRSLSPRETLPFYTIF
jgi:hypothetical protein